MANKLKAIEIIEPILRFLKNVIKKYFILSQNRHPLPFAEILICLQSINIKLICEIFDETQRKDVKENKTNFLQHLIFFLFAVSRQMYYRNINKITVNNEQQQFNSNRTYFVYNKVY